MPDFYGSNHPHSEFTELRRLHEWTVKWSYRPASRDAAPSPELAAIWATEELPQAAGIGDLTRVDALLAQGATPTAQALETALQHEKDNIADRLNEAAMAQKGPWFGSSLLQNAIVQEHQTSFEWLLSRGAGKFEKTDLSDALYVAASMQRIEIVRRLIEAGADPRVLPKHQVPMLFAAVDAHTGDQLPQDRARAQIEVIDLLIAAGADPLARSESLKESLLAASCGVYGHVDVVRHLLAMKVFDKAALEEAFHYNLYTPSPQILKLLLDNGAEMKSMDRIESVLSTPLSLEHYEIIPWLLDHGANPNAENSGGPALIHAVRCASADAVKTLLDRGADPRLPDKDGKTAYAHAIERAAANPSSSDAQRVRSMLEQTPSRD